MYDQCWSCYDQLLIIAMKDCWSYMINIDRCIISWPLLGTKRHQNPPQDLCLYWSVPSSHLASRPPAVLRLGTQSYMLSSAWSSTPPSLSSPSCKRSRPCAVGTHFVLLTVFKHKRIDVYLQYSGKPSRCSLRIYSPDFCIEPVPSAESILLRELSNEKCLLVELAL